MQPRACFKLLSKVWTSCKREVIHTVWLMRNTNWAVKTYEIKRIIEIILSWEVWARKAAGYIGTGKFTRFRKVGQCVGDPNVRVQLWWYQCLHLTPSHNLLYIWRASTPKCLSQKPEHHLTLYFAILAGQDIHRYLFPNVICIFNSTSSQFTMKLPRTTFTTILSLLALQHCQANPIFRRAPNSAQSLDSLGEVIQLADEAKDTAISNLHDSLLKVRDENGTTLSNSTFPFNPNSTTPTMPDPAAPTVLITFPDSAATSSPTSPSPSQPTSSSFLYMVEDGDTFSLIADLFGTTVADLETVNPGIDPNGLQAGEVIALPGNID